MALPLNIDDLIHRRKVECAWIEKTVRSVEKKTMSSTKRMAAIVATVALTVATSADAADVFSDAASWHRGFVGSGAFENGSTTQFPESLKLGDAANAAHAVAVSGYTKADANQITLRTERVIYPYANVTNDETVGYFPQKVVQNGMVSQNASTRGKPIVMPCSSARSVKG